MIPGNLVVYRSKAELIEAAALLLAGALRSALRTREICTFSLAGGSTPGPVYRMLADEAVVGSLPLERVAICFGDERCVPPDDNESNFKAARDAFGAGFSRFHAVHRIMGEKPYDEAVAAYNDVLKTPADVLLLGMGPDAHIASLFPGSSAFAASGARAVAVECPKPPPWRITVTPTVIREAGRIFVLAAGKEKASALAEVFSKPYDPLQRPAQLVTDATWLVDAAAASAYNPIIEPNKENEI